ncbi:hypothetical protein BK718_17105 [Bacillus thuringiensis serovar andalousiensis]|nr:hypothetical protein BK698_20360 [Bacillus thuringiensis serovar thuringiensis]OTX33483.1 hypothetical protein BK718_17105 [Bacillus thuringiensis serovar andalousiensis]
MFYKAIHLFIHSYYGAVLGFSFVTGLAEKLYKILYTLSVVFFRNAGDTPIHISLFFENKEK